MFSQIDISISGLKRSLHLNLIRENICQYTSWRYSAFSITRHMCMAVISIS